MAFIARSEEPPKEIKAHFASEPWSAALFNDPNLKPRLFSYYQEEPSSRFNTFITKTLRTSDTIRAWQNWIKTDAEPIEIVSAISFGSGVNGHVDTCHGGFVSALMDELLGNTIELHRPADKSSMTAYLKVDYKKPIRTPNKVLCRAWIEKKEGRKIYARGAIADGAGTVLTTAEALFIIVDVVKPLERL